MKKCLVAVDIQNDFVTGSLGSEEAKKIIPLVKERIEKAINTGEDFFFTKDTHDKNYLKRQEGKLLPIEHCIQGTKGHELCEEIKIYEKRAKDIFIKETFGYKDLPRYLEEYDAITFIGLCTDICVISNAILVKAFYPEKDIFLEEKCCAGSTVENHKSAIAVMKACHIKII